MNAPAPALVPVGIALGSNLGDRTTEIEAGFTFLQSLSADGTLRRSSILETDPVDCPPGSASFLNAVAEIEIDPAKLPPHDLLARLQAYEIQRGRPAGHGRNTPRAIDLDILYFGDLVLQDASLTLPHPRLAERDFVLRPLFELRPDFVPPGQGRTVRELLVTGSRRPSELN